MQTPTFINTHTHTPYKSFYTDSVRTTRWIVFCRHIQIYVCHPKTFIFYNWQRRTAKDIKQLVDRFHRYDCFSSASPFFFFFFLFSPFDSCSFYFPLYHLSLSLSLFHLKLILVPLFQISDIISMYHFVWHSLRFLYLPACLDVCSDFHRRSKKKTIEQCGSREKKSRKHSVIACSKKNESCFVEWQWKIYRFLTSTAHWKSIKKNCWCWWWYNQTQ